MISLLFFLSVGLAGDRAPDIVLPKLTKVPKSVYLVKKARVDSDVGEPIVYSDEQQMRMLYYDTFYKRDRLPLEDMGTNK